MTVEAIRDFFDKRFGKKESHPEAIKRIIQADSFDALKELMRSHQVSSVTVTLSSHLGLMGTIDTIKLQGIGQDPHDHRVRISYAEVHPGIDPLNLTRVLEVREADLKAELPNLHIIIPH